MVRSNNNVNSSYLKNPVEFSCQSPKHLRRNILLCTEWSLNLTNIYLTKSSILVIAKYMEKNLDITKPRYGERILPAFQLTLRSSIEVPLCNHAFHG